MPRTKRINQGGLVQHVLNRANAGMRIFKTDEDYEAFQRVLQEATDRFDMRILSYCVMPNHWHLLLWPREDGDLSRFMGWLTMTHTQRWHANRKTAGGGHLYQGRFKSFLVDTDEYLLTVARYIERNPVRANLIERAEEWKFSSAHRRCFGTTKEKSLLSDWPIDRPRQWRSFVNQALTPAEEEALRISIARGRPYGSPEWREEMVARFELDSTVRPRGRPIKGS